MAILYANRHRHRVCSAHEELTKQATWDWNWDGQEGCDGEKGSVRHVILIRHGQYVYDEEKHLTELGRDQARQLGQYLTTLQKRLNIDVTKIVASTMTRAQETCQIALENMDADLKLPAVENEPLIIEGPPHAPNPPHPTYVPSEEDIEKTSKRLNIAFEKYFTRPVEGKSLELFFCHGNVTRFYFCKLLQLPVSAWLRLGIRHCSITHLVIKSNGQVLCMAYGDSGFMNPESISSY